MGMVAWRKLQYPAGPQRWMGTHEWVRNLWFGWRKFAGQTMVYEAFAPYGIALRTGEAFRMPLIGTALKYRRAEIADMRSVGK